MTLRKPRERDGLAETSAHKLERRTRSALFRLRLGAHQSPSPENSGPAPKENSGPAPPHKEVAPAAEYTLLATSSTYGAGSYGKVMRGKDRAGLPVAIKCVADGRMRAGALESEVTILQTLSSDGGHPNIAAFRAWLPLGSKGVATEKGGPLPSALTNCHMVVMEACEGGEMFEHVVRRGGISEESAAPIMLQVCSALCHAHKRGVVHRDIKLENVLLARPQGSGSDALPMVKLIDWGLAHQHAMHPDGSVVPARLRSRCGSRSYMAPEVATRGATARGGDGYDGFAADVWSLGVCLFAMLFGFFPFDSSDPSVDWRAKTVMAAQQRGASSVATVFGFYEGKECAVSAEVVALIDGALRFEPSERVSLEQWLESAWLARHCPGLPKPPAAAAPLPIGVRLAPTRRGGERPSAPLDSCPMAERQDSQSTVRSDRSTASSISSVSSVACAAQGHAAPLPAIALAVAGGAHEAQFRSAAAYAARWRRSAASKRKNDCEAPTPLA